MYYCLALSKDSAYQPRLPDFINEDAMAKDTLYLLTFSLNARSPDPPVCAKFNSRSASTAGVGPKAGNCTAPALQHMPNKGCVLVPAVRSERQ